MHVHIIGTSGSGKTVLAQRLAERLHVPHIELDSIYWMPHWNHRSNQALLNAIQPTLTKPAWIIDGEYEQLNPIIWPKTDLVIWLDYPLSLIAWRLLRRGIRYACSKQNLWGSNNRETLPRLFSPQSIVQKACRSHQRRRAFYTKTIIHPNLAHLRFLRFVTPQATAKWVQMM